MKNTHQRILQDKPLANIIKIRIRTCSNALRYLQRESFFKLTVISLFLIIFWGGAYYLFYRGFKFLALFPGIGPLIAERILGLSFSAIFFMLVISGGITAYATLYRLAEIDFLFALPVNYSSVFIYKFLESLILSGWSVVFLLFPLLLGFTQAQKLPFSFLLFAYFFALPLVFFALTLGTLSACLIRCFLPKKPSLKWMLIVVFAGLSFCFYRLANPLTSGWEDPAPYNILNRILSHTRWSQFFLLPNHWLNKAVLSLAKKQSADAVFYFLLLLSNLLFFLALLDSFGRSLYYKSWANLKQAVNVNKHTSLLLIRAAERLKFCQWPIQALIIKDIKNFLRDPRQWLQFGIFFGFIFIYILNLRTLPFNLNIAFWKNLISILNLAAVSLTLAMFCVRFVFPAISLEGMRFWILGIAPVKKKEIILEKWGLSFLSCAIINIALMFFSGIMLGISGKAWVLSLLTALCVCFGVSGLSVGLGAALPSFKQDNPNAIVSGFGGTLLLVLSLLYVGMIVLAEALIFQGSFLKHCPDVYPAVIGSAVIILFSLAAGILPLLWGAKRLEGMEF